MLVDAHCHLNSLSPSIKKQVLTSGEGKFLFIDISINPQTALLSLELAEQYNFVYSCLGFHPFYVESFHQGILQEYERLISQSRKIVGIGEVGLDYKQGSLEKQKKVFTEFITLARQKKMPLVLHNRLNSSLMLDIVSRYYSSYETLIFHCFSQDKNFLQRVVDKGGFVSFSLNILRKNKRLTEAVKFCPLENLLCETDSPYMKVGKDLSTPLDLEKVISFIAEIKGVSFDELVEVIFTNAQRVFNLRNLF